ncbi:hypothetical protein ACQR0V_18440 [Bradyrhizobium sp. HKCCYLS2058]|uniref:hypothetical protein n=1 Tax=unclassified Bradyrhizobium TaxID=2631580 RepID=UPI0028E807D9|nr:hypothetical protein [Bradyrhizobium sp. SZCCHNS3002]
MSGYFDASQEHRWGGTELRGAWAISAAVAAIGLPAHRSCPDAGVGDGGLSPEEPHRGGEDRAGAMFDAMQMFEDASMVGKAAVTRIFEA